MADLEIYLDPTQTGATVTADLILDGAIAQAGVAFTEQAAPGVFHADAPAGLGAGTYTVRPFVDGANTSHFAFRWDGVGEVDMAQKIDDLHDFEGLGATALTLAGTTRTVGAKQVTVSGDGVNTATYARTG